MYVNNDDDDYYYYHYLLSTTRPTQPSIPPGSVNEDQLRLGRKKQVWFISLSDECGVCRYNCEP